MPRPAWLRVTWPPSRRTAAAGLLVGAAALSGGAWLGLSGGGRPVAGVPSPTAGVTPPQSAVPSRESAPPATPKLTPPPAGATCPLNGLPVDDPAALQRTALAVQIENHPAARPVRNLGLADMVVEATVEGDVTRYTGIFLCRATEGLTGPVRSGRYYSIDLWQDLHVLPYFFGAGHDARELYEEAGMPFVNGITGAWPWFQRWGSAAAPHNLYTNLEAARGAFTTDRRLQDLASRVGSLRPPFAFRAEARPTGRAAGSVVIWTNGFWHFGWTWNPDRLHWERDEAGTPNVDAGSGEILSARSVIVQLVREDVVYGPSDPAGNPRRYHHMVGSGTATLYLDGRAIDLRWSRPSAADGTSWTYADTGAAVSLPPGVVWWEIMPLSSRVVESGGSFS